MNGWRRIACLGLLTAVVGLPMACSHRTGRGGPGGPVTDSTQFTTGVFDGCPPEGRGGDPQLNRLKNRDLPPPAYESMTIAQILAIRMEHPEEMGRAKRSQWSRAALEEADKWENRGVSVEGYILMVRQQGPESCNCRSQEDRDYHVWIGANPSDDRAESVIMEVSPRLLPTHPNWRLRFFERLSQQRARVRISGWLMWDQEHPDQVGRTRGTQMEVHPIHNIEVYSGGRWRSLDSG